MAKKQETVKTVTREVGKVTQTTGKQALTTMSKDEMVVAVRNIRVELRGMMVKRHLGDKMNVKQYRLKKKELARLLTLIRQKEIQLQGQKEEK